HWYGCMLSSSGRLDEAEAQFRRAADLEPGSAVVMHGAAMNALFRRRFDEMMERSVRGLAYDPEYFLLRMWVGVAHQFQGLHPEIWREVESALTGALQAPAAERHVWLKQRCVDSEVRAEVEALLAVYTRAEGFLADAHVPGRLTGAKVGPYEIVAPIGAGGMG